MAGAVTEPPDVLAQIRAQGFDLEVVGDHLRIRPVERVTPELRDLLIRHKAELLSRLAPVGFVTLKGGLIVAVPALRLAVDLEARGLHPRLDERDQFVVDASPRLTDEDRAAIARWRRHLEAIVAYRVPEVA